MKYILSFCVVLAVALSVMPAASANAADSILITWLRNSSSGLCIQPEYEAALNGITIVQQPCNYDDTYQQWQHVYVRNGLYHFVNRGSGQCLDDRDGATADWSPVQQWTCNNTSTTMLWRPQELGGPYYIERFVNERSGKCLDVRSGSLDPGAVIQIYHCTSNNGAQSFSWSTVFNPR